MGWLTLAWAPILDQLPMGIVLLGPNNAPIFANKAALELLQCASLANVRDALVALFRPISDPLSGNNYEIELQFDGKTIAVQQTPLRSKGKETTTMILLTNISKWVALRTQLEEQKNAVQELEDVLDSCHDEIFVVDGEGTVKRINRAGESYYGHGEIPQMLGKSVYDLEKQGYFSPSVFDLVFKEKRPVTAMQTTRKGKYLLVTGNPTFDKNGRITRVVFTSRDVSELANLRKQLQDTEQLVEVYREKLISVTHNGVRLHKPIAESPQMKALLEVIDKVAKADSTVLLTGESGVGKGVLASRIHALSRRAEGPFIAINCGAIPEQLMESELFGYEGGAFTGARREGKKGLLELASGGTAFLDEVADLPLPMQTKLLQVIQEKRLMRIGGSKYVHMDTRFIAATNRDIERMVVEGSFRKDLYYRLNVIPIAIPPLRSRREDIPALINHFLVQLNARYEANKRLMPEALDILIHYHWPGNVRELENVVERLVVTTAKDEITATDVPDYITSQVTARGTRIQVLDICPLKEAIQETERQLVSMAYSRLKNTYKVASALSINQSTAVRKIHKYRLATSQDCRRGRPRRSSI